MPNVEHEAETWSLHVRAYYGDDYQYLSASTLGILVLPELVVPAPVIAGIGERVMSGSRVHARLAGTIDAKLSTRLEARDGQGTLIVAAARDADFTVPPGATSLVLTGTIDDGLGNARTTTRNVTVVPALTPVVAAETRGFDTGVPDVGDAWFGVARELHRATMLLGATRRAVLDANISAIAPLGTRLLVALDGIGLRIVDPDAQYATVATRPITGALRHMAATEHLALVEAGAQVIPVAIHGDDLAAGTALAIAGSVRDIQRRGDTLLVATSSGLYRVTESKAVALLASGPVRAIGQLARHVLAEADNGDLLTIGDDGVVQRTSLGLTADRLLVLQGEVLALSATTASVIDVRLPGRPVVSGEFGVALGGDATRALLSGGRVYVGGTAGAVLDLVRSAGDAQKRYETAAARGNVSALAFTDDGYVAAAGDYGAIELLPDADSVLRERAHPAPYTVATRGIATRGTLRYLLQSDFNRVVELDAAGHERVVLSGMPSSTWP